MADLDVPEVSVIVPAYNVTQYIGAALDSVLSQTFQNLEIIVVNDGCPDTAALDRALQPYLPRIRYIKQRNKGAAGARNAAIQAARAPLIFQLDPDDWLESSAVAEQVRVMREHREYDAAYCNAFCFSEGSLASGERGDLDRSLIMDAYPSNGPVSLCSIMDGRTGPRNPGAIIRREILLRIGLYDERFRCEEDLDLWLRILKADPPGRIGYTREPLVHYRLRHDSLTMEPGHAQALVDVMEKALRNFDLTAEERGCVERRLASDRVYVELIEGKRAIGERRWQDAIRSLKYCQQLRPERKTQVVLWLLRIFPWAALAGTRAWEYYLEKRLQRKAP
jgi:glycosyltransferase involved in cell wall biosynthesis